MKHWNTDVERDSIEDVLTADFESDVQTLIVSFDDSKEIAGQKGYRLEFEYRQFENYVVVDENTARGTVDVYFPLQWPPRIFQGIEKNYWFIFHVVNFLQRDFSCEFTLLSINFKTFKRMPRLRRDNIL